MKFSDIINDNLSDDYYRIKNKEEKEILNKLPGKPRMKDKYEGVVIAMNGNGEWECPALNIWHKKTSSDLKKAIDKKFEKNKNLKSEIKKSEHLDSKN